MAIDPTYGVVPPLTDEDYLSQLRAIDAQLFGTAPPAPVPPMAPAPTPVDTPLVLPRGSNERQPEPPPPPPPPPDAQQVGFAPPGPVGLPDVNAEVASPPAAPPQPEAPTIDEQLAPQERRTTGVGWLDDQFLLRDVMGHGTPTGAPAPRLTAEEHAELLLGDPDAAEELRFNLDRKRSDIIGRGSRDALRKYHEDETAARTELAAAKKRTADAIAKVEAESQQLNNAEVDTGHWWSSRNTFQQIAAVLAAVAGGFSSVKTGRNAPLEMIQHAIDQDIETQKANIANKRASAADRRNALAVAYERLGDMAQAEDAVRVAAYDKAIAEAQAAAQQYDPRGTQALGYYDTIMGLRQRRAVAVDEAQQKALDREIQRGEYNLKVSAENRALAKAAGAGASRNEFDKRIWSPDELAAISPGQPVPPVPMTFQDYKTWLLAQKTGNEVQATARAGLSDEQRKRLVGDLTQPDGTPFLANGSEGDITTLKARYQAAHTAVRSLDNILALRTGWTSDTIKGPEWQRIQAEYANAIGAAKDALALGALSGPDMDLVRQLLGNVDPTGVRDPSAGIRQARESVTNMLRDNLKGAGYKEPGRFAIPNLADLKPRESSPDEAELKGMLGMQTNPYARGKTADVVTGYSGTHTEASIRADQRGYSDAQEAYANRLAATVKDPNATPEARETAATKLRTIETTATSPGYKAFAKGLIEQLKPAKDRTFDITKPPAPYDPDYQAFKDWYSAKYGRPFLDDREFPTIRPEGQ